MADTPPRKNERDRRFPEDALAASPPSGALTVPGGITYPQEPPCGLGRALERALQANPALRERVEAFRRTERADLLWRLAKVLKVKVGELLE